jgi:hypothetical protein
MKFAPGHARTVAAPGLPSRLDRTPVSTGLSTDAVMGDDGSGRSDMFALHLDRRWLLFGSWKSVVAAAASVVFQTHRPARISVPPMSEEWLRQHDAQPSHGDLA